VASKLSFLLRMLVAVSAATVCVTAFSNTVPEHVRQRGKLLAGVSHVVPPYVAGAKFRTPEGIDTALVNEVARRMRVTPAIVQADIKNSTRLLAEGKADVVLAAVPDNALSRYPAGIIPTGYSAAPMAIMRTDTDIKTWEQLKGRKVCLSEGGLYAGTLAARYGALEKVYKAPADSLLALRIGGCDAAVHDDTLLNELITLPEWKKFSAKLPAGPRASLVFAVLEGHAKTAAFLKQLAREWKTKGYLDQQMKKMVRHIAFEVYLDQDVPDCH
jgi:polar amino acid transport system substrate-binding protein